ncbi:MAG: hypothetical protein ACRDJ3_10545 [Solirubrobacteraceae bacterium]
MTLGPRIARATVLMLATPLSAAVISACGSSTVKDLGTAHIARAIEESILSQRHIHATVSCPSLVLEEPGENFVCIAKTRKKGVSRTTLFAVTQHNNGHVTYRGE